MDSACADPYHEPPCSTLLIDIPPGARRVHPNIGGRP